MTDLRTRVGAELDLETADGFWLALLDEACAAEETIRQLEDLIRSDGLLSTGSKQQTVIHPAVAELRQQRAAFGRLLQLLAVPAESQSQKASRAARTRWGRG